jgi:ABC-type nitrate/sulfonate/bicarbonate transport system permease component
MRIALGTAWATVVAAELVVATAGFGFVIMSGYRNFESSIMAVGMIAVAATGFLMNLLFLAIERRVISWSERE